MYSSYYTASLPTIPSDSGRHSAFSDQSYTPSQSNRHGFDKTFSAQRSLREKKELPAVLNPHLQRSDAVKCTVDQEKLNDFAKNMSHRLQVRSVPLVDHDPRRYDRGSTMSMPFHKSLTKLNFQVVEDAKRTRLRSPLYRSEVSNVRPSVFRSNTTEVEKPKSFNPMFHGDITRQYMVHSFAHKHPLNHTKSSMRWRPQRTKGNQPWTIYDTKTRWGVLCISVTLPAKFWHIFIFLTYNQVLNDVMSSDIQKVSKSSDKNISWKTFL